MRAAALLALVLAGCTAGPGATAAPAPPATAAPATPTAVAPTPEPTLPPSPTPVANTVYTAEDEEIAKLIRAGADEAIPQLKLLRNMDPAERTELFLPLLGWITSQKAGVEAYTSSNCTTAAVELFIEGMDRYDDMRAKFLEWRDWGAHREPFAIGAPSQAVETFEESLAELETNCPA